MTRLYWKGGLEVADIEDKVHYKAVYYFFRELPPQYSRFGGLLGGVERLERVMVFADSEQDFYEVYMTSKTMDPNIW